MGLLFGNKKRVDPGAARMAQAMANANAGKNCINCAYYNKYSSYCTARQANMSPTLSCYAWRGQ